MTDTSLIARPIEHPFAHFVRILGKGKSGSRSLTREEARQAMGMVLDGNVEDVQLGAFLMLLRVKEESAEELAGFVDAVRQRIQAPALSVTLDWASYAGKRRQQAWYILAALALADSGVAVAMHGGAGHTAERIYSQDILTALGESCASGWQEASEALHQRNFVYLPLKLFCPRLQDIMDMRNLFGLRSPVHTLSRLINPSAAPYSIQSIFHPAYADNHQQAAALLGQSNAVVFKGEAGEAERKPEGSCTVKTITAGIKGETLWPKMLEGRQAWQDDMAIAPLLQAWCNDQTDSYAYAAITGTLAIALSLLEPELDQPQALLRAEQVWAGRNRARLPAL